MSADELQYDGHDLEALFELRNYQKWIADIFIPFLSGQGVEFGAGIGAISRWLVPHLETLDLVEPSPNLVERLAARFQGHAGVRIAPQSLETYVERTPDAALDTVILVNLLEHIEKDEAALHAFSRMLRPGGHLLLFVPAMPSLYSKLDRIVGHHRRYTRRSLSDKVRAAGFDITRLRYFDLLGVLPWWLVNTVGGKDHFDPNLSVLYDRVGVPVTRLIESLCPPPVGKNLVLVARRRSD